MPHDERAQRRRPRRQRPRHPGVHDRAGGRGHLRRGAAHGRRDLPHAEGAPQGQGALHRRRRRGRLRAEPRPATRPRSTSSCSAIERAGYRPGEDVLLALDAAASEFGERGRYRLRADRVEKSSEEMVAAATSPARRATRSSRSRTAWARTTGTAGGALTRRLGAPRPARGRRHLRHQPRHPPGGHPQGLANAVLVKVNQIGTLTETLEAIELAKRAGLRHGHLPPLGRDRGHLRRRPGRGRQRRPDQDRLARPRRAHREVQPAPAHRGGAGRAPPSGRGAPSSRASRGERAPRCVVAARGSSHGGRSPSPRRLRRPEPRAASGR